MEFYNTTMRVLAELGADTRQMLVVFNKLDKVDDPATLARLRGHFPDAVFVSVLTGAGLVELVDRITDFVRKDTVTVDLRLPAARSDLMARLHREGTQGAIRYEGDWTWVTATMPTRALDDFAPFLAPAGVDARGPLAPT